MSIVTDTKLVNTDDFFIADAVSFSDYYLFGMPMPNRNLKGDYRYGYQGEFAETDPETGKPAFKLRLYDPRINRWLSPDLYGQYHSPYMPMGNNPITMVDPDGGFACPDPPCNGIPQGATPLIAEGGFISDDTFNGGSLGEIVLKGFGSVLAAGSILSRTSRSLLGTLGTTFPEQRFLGFFRSMRYKG